MRFIAKITIPTDGGNKAIQGGSMPRIMQQALEKWKPEGAYFTCVDGNRTAFMVIDIKDPSDMPSFAEPFFMELGAKLDFYPAMSAQDLQTGLSKLPK